MSLRRPKPGEDDLDEMARQFEVDKEKVASIKTSNIVNKRPISDQENDSNKKQKSLFLQQREKQKEKADVKYQLPDISDKLEEQVLTEIVEKNLFGQVNVAAPVLPEVNKTSKHFPDIIKVLNKCQDDQQPSKKSLFSQQFQEMKKNIPRDIIQAEIPKGDVNLSAFGSGSCILTGGGLDSKEDITVLHKENINILQQMSEEEIFEEQEKLRKMLDPKLVEFIKLRRSDAKNKNEEAKNDVEMNDIEKENFNATSKEIKVADTNKPIDAMEVSADNVDLAKFPNMAKCEPDKLSWTGDLPSVKSGLLSGFSARFDFDGRLLAPDSDIPVTAGLHHHGEEQERPGYTVEEMVTLVRSSNSRQRVVGLDLMEKLLRRWWTGELDFCLEQNLIVELVSSGLMQLLRISLDCSEKGLVMAGARCMAALLYNEEEERLLDWEVGIRQPGLKPVTELEEVEQMTDHQLVVQDVVLGLLRMDILARLKYILDREHEELDKALVNALLAIVVRIARHSLVVAEAISRHPVLTRVVTKHWDNPLAVKLVRVLCGWGRHLAYTVQVSHNLAQLLGPHLASGADSRHDTLLCVESHRTWALLLSYGICQELWAELSQVTLTRLVSLYHRDQQETASCVGSWLGLVSRLAINLAEENSNPPNKIQWDQVIGLRDIMENCVRKWLAQLDQKQESENPNFGQLLATMSGCLSAYYRALANYDKCEMVKFLDDLEEFFTSVLLRFISSSYFSKCISSLLSCCYFSSHPASSRHPPSLPSVGVTLHGGKPHPLLTPQSQVILLEGVLDLVRTVVDIHKRLKPILNNTLSSTATQASDFFTKLVTCSPSLVSHWFSRPCSLLLHSLLHLYSPTLQSLSHPVALTLASLVHTQDTRILLDLFNNYLFNPSLLSVESLSSRVSSLALDTSIPVVPTPSGKPPPSPLSVVHASLTHLQSIMATYRQLLLSAASQTSPTPSKRKKATQRHCGETLLPSDWPYYPLLSLYNYTESTNHVKTSPPISSDEVQWSLAWLSLLPHSRPTPRYLRLCTVFLSPGSLFLFPNIHSLLHFHLTTLLSQGSGPDLSVSLPGISSNLDLYQQLVDQFSAESYGDFLFALYLVIPLAMSQPLSFRRHLWTEKSDSLQLIRISADKISPWTLARFLEPQEKDVCVLMAYFKSVVEGMVTNSRNGFLYKIATSHIEKLLSTNEDLDSELGKFKKFVQRELEKNSKLDHHFIAKLK